MLLPCPFTRGLITMPSAFDAAMSCQARKEREQADDTVPCCKDDKSQLYEQHDSEKFASSAAVEVFMRIRGARGVICYRYIRE